METTIRKTTSAVVTDYAKSCVNIETEFMPGVGVRFTGLIDRDIKESVLRVSTALVSIGMALPGNRKMLINIVPKLPKEVKATSHLDLPVAAALLAQMTGKEFDGDIVFAGELGLRGEVRETPVTWTLLGDFLHGRLEGKRLAVPMPEAMRGTQLPDGVVPVENLTDILALLH